MSKSIRFTNARRHLLMLACASALASTTSLHAQIPGGYPKKPITIVVPFSAGGPFDLIARALSAPLSEELGQAVIVENSPGASGMIGTSKVARAQPDGYTLLLGSTGTQALNPNVFHKVPYRSPQDFALTLPLFRGVLNPRFTRPFYAVPRTSVVHTAWD